MGRVICIESIPGVDRTFILEQIEDKIPCLYIEQDHILLALYLGNPKKYSMAYDVVLLREFEDVLEKSKRYDTDVFVNQGPTHLSIVFYLQHCNGYISREEYKYLQRGLNTITEKYNVSSVYLHCPIDRAMGWIWRYGRLCEISCYGWKYLDNFSQEYNKRKDILTLEWTKLEDTNVLLVILPWIPKRV